MLCYILVHLDEVTEEDSRVTVNELYTALKWWICVLPAPMDPATSHNNEGGASLTSPAPRAGGSHVVDQLHKVLHHEGGAAMFKQFADESAGRYARSGLVDASPWILQCVCSNILQCVVLIWCTGVEGYLVQRWTLVGESFAMESCPIGKSRAPSFVTSCQCVG